MGALIQRREIQGLQQFVLAMGMGILEVCLMLDLYFCMDSGR